MLVTEDTPGNAKQELKEYPQMGEGNFRIGKLQDKYDIVLENAERVKPFLDLLMEDCNNTRIW